MTIDDCTRLAYAEVLAGEDGPTPAVFLTNNGKCYLSQAVQAVVAHAYLRHRRTQLYRPQTNGKAERFIRTLLHKWAYTQVYGRSAVRTAAFPCYLRFYNTERYHTSLGFTTPA